MRGLLALVVAACGTSTDGPVTLGAGSGAQCVAVAGKARFTVGIDLLRNRGDEAITVTDVSLVRPRNLELVRTWLVPIYHDKSDGTKNYVGTWPSYPPPASEVKPEWVNRVPAKGATLPPGDQLGPAFGLEKQAERASAQRIVVDYETASGEAYQASTTTWILARGDCG